MPAQTIEGISLKISGEKPFEYIAQNLENIFEVPRFSPKSDLLAMLIDVIPSQAAGDINSRCTFKTSERNLKLWVKY